MSFADMPPLQKKEEETVNPTENVSSGSKEREDFYINLEDGWNQNGFYYLKRIKEIIPHLDLSNRKIEQTEMYLETIHSALKFGAEDSSSHTGLQNEVEHIEEESKKYIDKPNNNYYLNEYLKLIISQKGDILKAWKYSQTHHDQLGMYITPEYFITRSGEVVYQNLNQIPNESNYGSVNAINQKRKELLKNKNLNQVFEISEADFYNFDEQQASMSEEDGYTYSKQPQEFLLNKLTTKDSLTKKEKEKRKNEYLNFMTNGLRQVVEKDFAFNLVELSIPEQFFFLEYIKRTSCKDAQKVKEISKMHKTNFFKTFLSIEHGGKEMGEKILTLGEKLPETSAKALFHTYSEIINATDEVGTLLKENLGDKATPELITETKESLLVTGKDLLRTYGDKTELCEGLDCDALGKELEERLALAKSSVFAFSYACKTLASKGEFSFEDFKKAKLAYDKSPLPEKMKQDIIAMHQENTKQYPEKLRDAWRTTLRDGLENENPNQLIVSVSHEDDIVSAMRVIKQGDGSWYGASFNVNPTIQGSRIGTELLKKVIEDLAKDRPFVADCYSGNPMLNTYIEKFGFVITQEIPNYHNTGELVYQITLYPKKEEVLQQPEPNIHQK